MIIKGFLDRSFSPPAPAVRAFISIERLGVEGYVKLLIDTGASSTAMLDKDRELLGIDLKRIERAPVKIGGIGGLVDTYLARNAKLSLRTQNGEYYVEWHAAVELLRELRKERDMLTEVLG